MASLLLLCYHTIGCKKKPSHIFLKLFIHVWVSVELVWTTLLMPHSLDFLPTPWGLLRSPKHPKLMTLSHHTPVPARTLAKRWVLQDRWMETLLILWGGCFKEFQQHPHFQQEKMHCIGAKPSRLFCKIQK